MLHTSAAYPMDATVSSLASTITLAGTENWNDFSRVTWLSGDHHIYPSFAHFQRTLGLMGFIFVVSSSLAPGRILQMLNTIEFILCCWYKYAQIVRAIKA